MFTNRKHRYFILITVAFLYSDFLLAQQRGGSFEIAIATIKKNVQCCSVAFSNDKSNKATTVLIFENAEMTIVYNNNRPPVSFNLLALYKDTQSSQGIDYKRGTKTIVFNISEFNAQAIRFNTASKANETFHQLLYIINSVSKEK